MAVARRIALSILPYRYATALRSLPRALSLVGRRYACPCCGWRFRRLQPVKERSNAKCPWCGSLERHRLLALYLAERTSVLRVPMDVLHVAPEEGIGRLLRRARAARVVSIDLHHPRADRRMDVRAMDFPDERFDLILCSHVLEHVQDDRAAMAELRRVLRPGGTLLVMVPFNGASATTLEDPTVVDPAERTRLFGQHDHVRLYGRDLLDRLRAAGLDVVEEHFCESLPDEVVRRHALTTAPIFRCTKADTVPGG